MEKNTDDVTDEIKQIWKPSRFDPNGCYIGNSKTDKKPVQDQDDL